MFTIPQCSALSIWGVKTWAPGHTTEREVSPLPSISYEDRERERNAEREAAEREEERENQRVREFFNIIT